MLVRKFPDLVVGNEGQSIASVLPHAYRLHHDRNARYLVIRSLSILVFRGLRFNGKSECGGKIGDPARGRDGTRAGREAETCPFLAE
jgi:hypothetical protein